MTARSGYASRGRPNTSTEHYAYLFGEAGLPDGMMIYEDLGFSNGLFCSPATYRELIMPYHKELFGFFHSHGLEIARKIPALKRLGAAYIFDSDHSVPPAPGWRSAGSGGGWGRGRDRMSRPDSFRGREREVVAWVELDGEGVL